MGELKFRYQKFYFNNFKLKFRVVNQQRMLLQIGRQKLKRRILML